ncbi:transcriptional regulator [Lysobacter sp. Root916]|uniref:helix-turn-helix transcriptional regulator n=1 Tax=Lysobacter sp. Root916 TaxID=1736606 RepID=UPI000709417C|nr:AraC family transcriptional regulator [Lysobacter sp. Root916]KRD39155.1 transcriptional regulator [Lysobacter sp. Root916]
MPALPSSSAWIGTLLLGEHVAALQGRAGRSLRHAHYAHQLLLSDAEPWLVEVDGKRRQAHRLWLPSFQSHAVLAAPAEGCTIFLEPSHVDVDAVLAQLPNLPAQLSALQPLLSGLCRARPLDRRLQAAIAEIGARLPHSVSAADIAQAAHWSTSQLQRRFQSDLAVTLRGWVLWRRLHQALLRLLAGDSLTDSAHAAGFADLAHLSRSLRRMFGIGAAQLRGLRLQT